MILLILSVASTAFGLLATISVLRWKPRKQSVKLRPSGVTIVKPIRGLEPDLRENLESFFQLKTKTAYEIFFCVKNPEDPAVKVVEALIEEYPLINAKLYTNTPDLGRNPKVSNMHYAWNRASYDLLLISDSNVRVTPDYLESLLIERQKGAGLVTQAVYGVDARTAGGHLDVVHLNTFYLKATAFLKLCGFECVLGKCMFFSRSQFDALGGLFSVRNYLAEDLVAGEMMREAGYNVSIAPQLLRQTTVMTDIDSYLNRHMRWARLRKCHGLSTYFLEPLMFETFWPLLLILTTASSKSTTVGFLCLAVQLLSNIVVHLVKFNEKGTWRSFPWFVLKDLLAPYIWLGGLMSNKVIWRGQTLYLRFGGKLSKRSATKRYLLPFS